MQHLDSGLVADLGCGAKSPAPLRKGARGVGLDHFNDGFACVAACQQFDEGLGGVL